ncbi:MAG TPA: hypothetical protein VG245_04270, partial [Candidatus Dormibacteraeota bacterium]|nr:hypothetical protein [Candidatus Dormibacteraeota bacterium]
MITSFLRGACQASAAISISTIFGWDGEDRLLQRYIAIWTLALAGFVAALYLTGLPGWVFVVLAGLALYRLQDLVFASLDDALQLTPRDNQFNVLPHGFAVQVGLVNIVQIVLIFALCLKVFAANDFDAAANHLTTPFDYLYLSWMVLLPPGSGYNASTWVGRALSMLESGVGLLVVVLALSSFLSRVGGGTPGGAAAPGGDA